MTSSAFRFGDYRLDPAARELRLGDELVPLPPKSFDCLAYLVEHRERAVGRDELIGAVWARTDVSDDVLAQTLLRARRAVGDTGNDQHAIRTVPRFGYRWILPVEDIGGTKGISADDPQTPAAETPGKRRRIAAGATLALGAVAVLAALALVPRRHAPAPAFADAAPDDRLSIVLPVDVDGGHASDAWIRLGAMDYVASRLREAAGRKVLPSAQTVQLIGNDAGPTDAGTLHRLELASGAAWILVPHAAYSGRDWSFVLDVYHGGGVQSYEARAPHALDAAALTIDRFMTSLGLARNGQPSAASPAVELVQRIDAAMLAGDLAEAHRLADGASDSLREDPAVAVRIGQVAFRAGRVDDAEQSFAPIAKNASVPAPVRSQAEMGLGAVAVRRADFDAADRHYSAAIAMLAGAVGRDRPDLLGTAYTGRGVANGARERFDAALADFARARVELERAGDHGGMASVEVNLALVESSRSRYGEAVAAFDRAIATFSRFDVRDNLAAALLGKANAELALLDRDGALESSARAEDLSRHLENPLLKRRIRNTRVRALLFAGDLSSARHLLDGAADADGEGAVEIALLHARLALELGDAGEAAKELTKALAAPPADRGSNLSDLVLLAVEIARRTHGGALLDRARAELEAAPEPPGDRDRALALELGAAELAALRGDADAKTHFSAALALADRRGSPETLVTSGVAYASYLLDRHEADAAIAVVGRLAPYADRDYRAARAAADLYAALGSPDLARSARARANALAGERSPSGAY